jgi:hypothetical protein
VSVAACINSFALIGEASFSIFIIICRINMFCMRDTGGSTGPRILVPKIARSWFASSCALCLQICDD